MFFASAFLTGLIIAGCIIVLIEWDVRRRRRNRRERYAAMMAYSDNEHYRMLAGHSPEDRHLVHTLYLLNTGRIDKDEARRLLDIETPRAE